MNAGEPRRGAELDAGDSGRAGAQHGELRSDQPAGQVSHVSLVMCVMLSRVMSVMLSRGRNTETWIEKAQNFFEGKQVY